MDSGEIDDLLNDPAALADPALLGAIANGLLSSLSDGEDSGVDVSLKSYFVPIFCGLYINNVSEVFFFHSYIDCHHLQLR